MELTVRKRLNPKTQIDLKVEGQNLEECVFLASAIINAPEVCGKCSSENINIKTRVVKDKEKGDRYKYIEYHCNDCHARQPWSLYLNPQGVSYLKDWEEAYRPNGG